MDKKHKDSLTTNRVSIMENLLIDELFLSYMSQDGILLDSHCEQIDRKGATTSEKITEFLRIFPRRGPKAMSCFFVALHKTEQGHIADTLDPDLSRQIKAQLDSGEGAVYQPNGTHAGSLAIPANQPVFDEIDLDKNDSAFIDVDVKSIDPNSEATQRLLNDPNVYNMRWKKKSRALIINNTSFDPPLTERQGSTFDGVNLNGLLEKLGFDTRMEDDLTAKRMVEVIDAERKNGDHQDAGSFVLAIFSHGTEGGVYGTDGKLVKIKLIKTLLDGNNCRGLHGKPKLLIIQACQGDQATQGVVADADMDEPPVLDELAQAIANLQLSEGHSAAASDDGFVTAVTTAGHEKGHLIVASSTVPGYKSWRLPEKGTWFIRVLVKIFMHYAHKEHVSDMLTRVRRAVGKKQTSFHAGQAVQMTHDDNTLDKQWFLFPGLPHTS